MKAHKTPYEIASIPIIELRTYKHETLAYDMKDARMCGGATLLETIYLTEHNILSGFAISGSTFFKATNHMTHCDIYPN